MNLQTVIHFLHSRAQFCYLLPCSPECIHCQGERGVLIKFYLNAGRFTGYSLLDPASTPYMFNAAGRVKPVSVDTFIEPVELELDFHCDHTDVSASTLYDLQCILPGWPRVGDGMPKGLWFSNANLTIDAKVRSCSVD